MLNKDFNHLLYTQLILEDQRMIDEYIPKMAPDEINSFMRRLIEYYKFEKKEDVVEVNEEADTILVFEKPNITLLPKFKKTKCDLVFFDKIIESFDKNILELENKKNKSKFFLCKAIKQYFEEERLAFNKEKINLSFSNIKNNIYKNYIKYVKNKDYVYSIDTELPMRLYTRRTDKNKNVKMCLGIAIDIIALPSTNTKIGGYNQNYKLDIHLLKTKDGIDLKPFIKNSGFWAPQNAKLHNFNNKTGIIWLNGKVDNEQWQFPDGNCIDKNINVIISASCTTDAFSKMLQRFNLNKRIQKILLGLETRNSNM